MIATIRDLLKQKISFRLYRGSAFRKLMLSFLVMLILPFMVLLFNYLYARQLLRQENLNYQNAVLVQAQKMVDEKLQALQLMALDISSDSDISAFLRSSDLSGSKLQLKVREISQRLASFGANYQELCQCFVYSANYDYLIGSSYADSNVSSRIIRLKSESLNQQLQQKLVEPRQFCRYSALYDDQTCQLVMIHSVPLWVTGEPENGSVCLLVNQENLLHNISSMEELRSGLVCLLDAQGTPIMSTGDDALKTSVAQAYASGRGFIQIDGMQYTVSLVDSELNDWHYISIQPQHTMLPRLQLTRNLSILVFFVILLLGVGIAYLLSRTNYRPIQNLMGVLRRQAWLLRQKADNENEFDLIERSVNDMTSSMNTMRTMIQDELSYVQEGMLLQLLRNAVTDYAVYRKTLANAGILLPYHQFSVAVIRQLPLENGLEEQALANVVIKEKLVKIMPCTISFAGAVMQSDTLAVILNSDLPDFEAQAETALNTLASCVREEFSYMLEITLSRTCESIDRVPHAYYTASQHKPLLPGGGVTLLSHQPPARLEHAPEEISIPLQNCIATGDLQQALCLLQQNYQQCIEGKVFPLYILRGYYVNLLAIVNAALPQDIDDGDTTDWLQMLFMQSTTADMQQTVEKRVQILCRYVQEGQKSHASQMIAKILDFLKNEYSNSELTLSSTADHFCITSSYLSTFFKENVGDTFLNYLTRMRINQAKELMRSTNLTIGEIAIRVGYANGNTFARTFKKMEQVTPSQYRDSILS